MVPVLSADRVSVSIEAIAEPDKIIELEPDQPFRIAVAGAFSGAGPVAERVPMQVDRDNFEEVLAACAPRIETPAGEIVVRELDDFHPDAIYTRLPVFERLRDLRSRVGDPETFAGAARELLGQPEPRQHGDLLSELLSEAAAPKRATDDLQQLVQDLVRPHLVPKADPRAPELIRQLDDAASSILRSILHHPAFQATEALWRTVYTMVRRLQTGVDLKLCLLDITKEELLSGEPETYDLFLERSDPYAVIACNCTFGVEDIPRLYHLARVAKGIGAPLLAEADLSLLDAGSEWTDFRRSPEARWVGLALPRVLARLPYGAAQTPCEALAFEELPPGEPDPKQMVWMNPALVCALLMGQAFESSGWSMRPGAVRDLDDLPVYVYKDGAGESAAAPCAEIEISEATAEALIDNGVMPLAWIHNSDVVRVVRFQSVAHPTAPLAGRWT